MKRQGTPKRRSMKLQHRGVVEQLGADPAALAPGRDHQHRHPGPEADRHAVEVLVPDRQRAAALIAVELGVHRRHGGRHMVEEAVILVVVHDQGGLGPDLRVAGQRLEDLVDEGLAGGGRGVGVLAEGVGADHPGHLRQPVGLDVVGDRPRQHGVIGILVRGQLGADIGAAALVQVGALVQLAEVAVIGQRVAAIIGIGLVDPPVDAVLLQRLGIGLPGEPFPGLVEVHVAGPVVVQLLPVQPALRVLRVAAGQGVDAGAAGEVLPVRLGVGEDRAVVGVADR